MQKKLASLVAAALYSRLILFIYSKGWHLQKQCQGNYGKTVEIENESSISTLNWPIEKTIEERQK